MRVGFFQFAPEFAAKTANLAKVERALSAADADLIVLPELFSTGYCFSSRDEIFGLAEDLHTGPTATRLAALARETGITIVAGIAERSSDALYNSCLVVAPGGNRRTYRKIHLFDREKQLFDRSDTRPGVWAVPGRDKAIPRVAPFPDRIGGQDFAQIGVMICFDYFFPELARTLALAGAQIICHPANLILPHAQQITVTRALENRVFWILCNRTGAEEHAGQSLTFTGQSQIIAPSGEILFRAGIGDEVLKVVDIEPVEADNKIVGNNHLFKDRRPDMYDTESPKS